MLAEIKTDLDKAAEEAEINNLATHFRTIVSEFYTADNVPQTTQAQTPTLEDSAADSDISAGKFGWTTMLEDVLLPFIKRNGNDFVAEIMVKKTIFSDPKLNFVSHEVMECWELVQYPIEEKEAKLLNEINQEHCNGMFGKHRYTKGDVVFELNDLKVFLQFVQICGDMIVGMTKSNPFFGFIQINSENSVPFVYDGSHQLVPLFYFESDSNYLNEKAKQLTDVQKLSCFKFCCKVQKIKRDFYIQDSILVVDFKEVKKLFPSDTRFELYWPGESNSELIPLQLKGQNLLETKQRTSASKTLFTAMEIPETDIFSTSPKTYEVLSEIPFKDSKIAQPVAAIKNLSLIHKSISSSILSLQQQNSSSLQIQRAAALPINSPVPQQGCVTQPKNFTLCQSSTSVNISWPQVQTVSLPQNPLKSQVTATYPSLAQQSVAPPSCYSPFTATSPLQHSQRTYLQPKSVTSSTTSSLSQLQTYVSPTNSKQNVYSKSATLPQNVSVSKKISVAPVPVISVIQYKNGKSSKNNHNKRIKNIKTINTVSRRSSNTTPPSPFLKTSNHQLSPRLVTDIKESNYYYQNSTCTKNLLSSNSQVASSSVSSSISQPRSNISSRSIPYSLPKSVSSVVSSSLSPNLRSSMISMPISDNIQQNIIDRGGSPKDTSLTYTSVRPNQFLSYSTLQTPSQNQSTQGMQQNHHYSQQSKTTAKQYSTPPYHTNRQFYTENANIPANIDNFNTFQPQSNPIHMHHIPQAIPTNVSKNYDFSLNNILDYNNYYSQTLNFYYQTLNHQMQNFNQTFTQHMGLNMSLNNNVVPNKDSSQVYLLNQSTNSNSMTNQSYFRQNNIPTVLENNYSVEIYMQDTNILKFLLSANDGKCWIPVDEIISFFSEFNKDFVYRALEKLNLEFKVLHKDLHEVWEKATKHTLYGYSVPAQNKDELVILLQALCEIIKCFRKENN